MNNKLQYYIKSARLRTLPLSASGIVLGVFLAARDGVFNLEIALFSVVTALSLQILSNYANELGDLQKGTDNSKRLGPQRSIQKGYLSERNIYGMMILFIIISIFLGAALVWLSFDSLTSASAITMEVLGLLAIVASIKYTFGKKAYGYAGLGDLFVFIFFGLVSVCGAYYLLVHTLKFSILLPASSIGLLSVAMLNVNNMRDVDNDTAFSKKTIAVRAGLRNAKRYHLLLIMIAFATAVTFNIFEKNSIFSYLFLITAPTFYKHLRFIFGSEGRNLDKQMKVISISTLLFTFTFGIGLLIG